jgi:hypothetical protein
LNNDVSPACTVTDKATPQPIEPAAATFSVTFDSTKNPSSTWGFMRGSLINITFTETGDSNPFDATFVLNGNASGPISLGTASIPSGTQVYTLNISSYTPVQIPTGDYHLDVLIFQSAVYVKTVTLTLDIARVPSVPNSATVACAYQWSATALVVNCTWGTFYPFEGSSFVIQVRNGATVENFSYTPTYPGYKTGITSKVTLAFGDGLVYNAAVSFILDDGAGHARSSNNTIVVSVNPLYSNYPIGHGSSITHDWGSWYVGSSGSSYFYSTNVKQYCNVGVNDCDNASITIGWHFWGTTSQDIQIHINSTYGPAFYSSAVSGTTRMYAVPFNVPILISVSGSEQLYVCTSHVQNTCFSAGYHTFLLTGYTTWTFTRPIQKIPALPGIPLDFSARPGTANATLSWKTPASNGGWPITNYRIYMGTSPGAETLLVTVGNVTSYTATGLTGGSVYYFKVCAVTKAGDSATSSEATASPSTSLDPAVTVVTVLVVLGIGIAALVIAIDVSKKKKAAARTIRKH